MKKFPLCLTMFMIGAGPAFAEETVKWVTANSLQWADAPPALPKGAKAAVVSGDPSKEEVYVIRLQMPAGYRVPAHQHPTAEYVTVLAGDFSFGAGDKFDAGKGHELGAGDFVEAPAAMNHYAWTTTGATIQVYGQGPFAITYVNPADDPRK